MVILPELTKTKNMKTYRLSFEDCNKNELSYQIITANNIKEARDFASAKLAESQMNDLKRIKVKKQ